MYIISEFMRPLTFEESNGNMIVLPAIINPKIPVSRNFAVPACESRMFARAKKRSTKTKKVKLLAEKQVVFSCNKIEVVDFVSTDQFVFKSPGILPTGYRRESSGRRFQGGTSYNDVAFSLVWVEN